MSGNRPVRFIGLTLILILSLSAGLYSCGDVTGSKKNDPDNPTIQPGKLYISNLGDGSLIAFDNASTAEGNIPPSRRFPESITGPTGIFLDQASDTLYVANTDHNSILIYENASTQNPSAGFASADRVISGTKTGLNHPYAVVYDAGRGLLYVANKENSIAVFSAECAGVAALEGNIAPCRTLSGISTLLDFPRGLALDANRDILYISNMGTNSILVYADASQSTTQGNLAPTREIRGHSESETESILEIPFGVAIDSIHDRLYVVNTGRNQPAVLIFENASGRSGGAMPEHVITGLSTQLTQPAGIALVVTGNSTRIYVINSNNTNNGSTPLVVFGDIETLCPGHLCDVAPSQLLSGPQTTLTSAVGIAYDPARDIFYVGNTGGNSILAFSFQGNLAPIKTNSGSQTHLLQPVSFFYDKTLDRLYVVNLGSGVPHIIVYENATDPDKFFLNTNKKEDWGLTDGSGNEIIQPRAMYIDQTRNLLIILNGFYNQLLLYPMSSPFPSANPAGQTHVINSPTMVPIVTLFGAGSVKAMTVDEGRGDVYISIDCTTNDASQCGGSQPQGNRIVVYNVASQSTRIISGSSTGLHRPVGLFFDSTRDILYVTNGRHSGTNGPTANSVLAFDNASTVSGDAIPNRIISSGAEFAAAEKMSTPFAPYVNVGADRLFLLNKGNDAIFIFDHASTRTGATKPDRIISGTNTQLALTSASSPFDNTSLPAALFVDTSQGKETIYVGQPKDLTCTGLSCPDEGSLLIFALEGNVPPGRVLSGGEAPLVGPSAMAVDTTRDILYMANQGDPSLTADDSLFAFSGVSSIEGSLANHRSLCSPAATPPCPETKLNNPAGLFIDSEKDRLYVSNSGTDCSNNNPNGNVTQCNAILVFYVASGLDGNAVTDQVITSPVLNSPHGLALDTETKTLYVANTGGHSVLVFKNVEGLNGTVTPDAEIGGIQSQVNAPVGVAIDPGRDILYVLNQGDPGVLVFDQASTRNGNTPPSRVISGTGFMKSPTALFLDPQSNTLYVADQEVNAVFVYNNASVADGAAEHKTLIGNNTGLNRPSAIFVDTTR